MRGDVGCRIQHETPLPEMRVRYGQVGAGKSPARPQNNVQIESAGTPSLSAPDASEIALCLLKQRQHLRRWKIGASQQDRICIYSLRRPYGGADINRCDRVHCNVLRLQCLWHRPHYRGGRAVPDMTLIRSQRDQITVCAHVGGIRYPRRYGHTVQAAGRGRNPYPRGVSAPEQDPTW